MRSLFLEILILASAVVGSAQTLTGVVLDRDGAAVENASVFFLEGNHQKAETQTDSEGRFSIPITIGLRSRLAVTAQGFAPFERSVKNDGVWDFTIVLHPAPVAADVTVSVTRSETRLSETPASIIILSRENLNSTAAQTVDDSLRQIAGFTLFRRSSSTTTNPTAQGANLRGVSGSGVSRAAVLFDGLSLNDAFGGWTYWSRVPLIAVEQIEVLRGGASSYYGTSGLSGAVNIVPKHTNENGPVFNLETSAGSQSTYNGGLFTALRKSGWGLALAAETFQTAGYIPVAASERGLADTRADSRHNNVIFGVEKRFGFLSQRRGIEEHNAGRLFVRGDLFSEQRDNGTTLTYNKTDFRQAAGGGDISSGKLGDFRLRLFAEAQVYDQTFSAFSADRNTETLTRLQRVPSQTAGASIFWTKSFTGHAFASSIETREVRGFSDELGFAAGRPAVVIGAGGRERTVAFFAQDNWSASEKLNLNFGLRVDHWRNFGAHSSTRPLATNIVTDAAFPDRDETAVSPRVAAIYQINRMVSVYGSYTRSFRAPTLNELYRGFRVGNVVTQANEKLRAEHANTFEGGVNLTALKNRFSLRGNVFVTTISDPVVSVTLSATPTLITRQRQNVGETRTRGLELDAEFSPRNDLRLSASYLLADSRVTAFTANTLLIGKLLPQIPHQQFNFQIGYSPSERFSFGAQARISDTQFEDDLNTLRLRPYFTADAMAVYRVNKQIEFFAAAENVFNSRYDIGLTPNRTVAAPAFVRLGLRFGLGGK